MTRFECSREQDVLDALASRRWPARCDAELRDHVASCALCTDLVAVAGALLDEADDLAADALPPASVIWWRAQLRAREEAARAAARPLRVAQQVAAALGIALLVVWCWASASYIRSSVGSVLAVVPRIDAQAIGARAVAALPAFDASALAQSALAALASPAVQLAAGAWLILAPVAIYLAVARD